MLSVVRFISLSIGVIAAAVLVYDAAKIIRALRASAAPDMRTVAYSATSGREGRRLLVIGDSTAVGTGAEDPRQTVAGRIGGAIDDLYIENKGVVGALAGELSGQLASTAVDQFDAILVQIGGNDILQWTPLDELQSHLGEALKDATSRAPQVALIVPGLVGDAPAIPWPINYLVNRRSRQVRLVCREIAARYGVHFVDLTVAIDADDIAELSDAQGYAPDGLHPSGQGYGRWYDALQEQTPLLDWLRRASRSFQSEQRSL